MGEAVYFLCALTSVGCAFLLLRHYRSGGRTRLLLWCSVAFVGLAANNVLLFLDHMVPTIDLALARSLTGLIGLLVLLFGLIWHSGAPRS